MTPIPVKTETNAFLEFFRTLFFYLVIEKPFDPLQLFLLVLLISLGAYLIRFGGFIKLMGKIIAVFGIAVLALRILVVLYLASQP